MIEATPSYLQTASGLETPTWSSPSNPYTPTPSDDLLSAPLPSWQAETVAPPSLAPAQTSPAQPSPYAYQPAARAAEPSEPSWSSPYSEPYSYDSTSDYLTSTEPVAAPQPAPEPEPAPVARAGRRAARVAVDSPSTVQAAVPAADTYYQSAPALPEQDDFLTPSKPLPTVPSYGPEPSYTQAASYNSPAPSYAPETTYPAYDAPASTPDYETSYTSDYSSNYQYSEPAAPATPEPTYTADTNYSSSSYDSYSSERLVRVVQPGYELRLVHAGAGDLLQRY